MQDAPTRRPALPAVLLLIAMLSACKGGESASANTADDPATRGWTPDARIMAQAGPVVIAPPSVRYTGGAVASAGSVSGTVSLSAPLTPLPPVAAGRDSGVCGAAIPDSSLEQRGTGLGNVVVWLDGVRKGKPIPLEKRLELESDHCLLTPRVQAAVTSSAVNVIGHDDFRQHLHFFSSGEKAPRATVLLGKDEQVIPTEHPAASPGLVFVRDVDHSWPAAYIAVFDHPYFAVTKPDGSFTIDGVPPGEYTVKAWHERTKLAEQKVTVPANGAAKMNIALTGKS